MKLTIFDLLGRNGLFFLNYTKYFAEQLTRTLTRVDSRASAFLENPDADNVHDLRTSIRRAEAHIRLLPKNLRTKVDVTTYLRYAKALFRATTEIRDIDIISIGLYEYKSFKELNQLLANNENKRKSLLRNARKFGVIFQKTEFLRIKSSQLSQRKFEKRRKKIVNRLKDSLIVQSENLLSNRDPEKLHEFRKTCKQLRYSLEIDTGVQKKLIRLLVQIQRTLGTFMDIHTTLSCFSSSSLGDSLKPIVNKLESGREKAYVSFMKLLKEKFMPTIKNLAV